jgi:hypothetical protein
LSIVTFDEICEALSPNYNKEELFYSVRKLSEAKYITLKNFHDDGGYYIEGITFEGHMFYKELRKPV